MGKAIPSSSWWAAKKDTWFICRFRKRRKFNFIQLFPNWERNSCHFYTVEVSNDKQNWNQIIDMTKYHLPSHVDGNLHKVENSSAQVYSRQY